MKKLYKFMVLCACLLALMMMTTIMASAESKFPNVLGGKLENGLMGIAYYYENDLHVEIQAAIEGAIDDWEWAINDSAVMENSDLQCHFVRTHTLSGTLHIQFLEADLGLDGKIAEVEWYKEGLVDPMQSSWECCVVYVDPKEFLILTAEQQRAVICHEIGHVLGLAHNFDDNGVLMWPYLFGATDGINYYPSATAYVPTEEDLRNIRYLYE